MARKAAILFMQSQTVLKFTLAAFHAIVRNVDFKIIINLSFSLCPCVSIAQQQCQILANFNFESTSRSLRNNMVTTASYSHYHVLPWRWYVQGESISFQIHFTCRPKNSTLDFSDKCICTLFSTWLVTNGTSVIRSCIWDFLWLSLTMSFFSLLFQNVKLRNARLKMCFA